MTGVPEQGLGREHPGSWPWRPGCWPQCKPDLLTRPAHAARVWSWQRPSVAGGPSLLSPRGHSRCGRSPASPLPPAWPAAQPLFATFPGFYRFLAGFRLETEMQLLRLALQLGAGSPKPGSPISSVSHEGLFLGKSDPCIVQASWAWGEGDRERGRGRFRREGLCGSAVFASLRDDRPGFLAPSILRHNKVKIKWH